MVNFDCGFCRSGMRANMQRRSCNAIIQANHTFPSAFCLCLIKTEKLLPDVLKAPPSTYQVHCGSGSIGAAFVYMGFAGRSADQTWVDAAARHGRGNNDTARSDDFVNPRIYSPHLYR